PKCTRRQPSRLGLHNAPLRDPQLYSMRPPNPAAAMLFGHPPAAMRETPDTLARLCDGAAWILLAVLAGISYLTFADYGLGWDDYTHSQYGQLLLDYYASGFSDRRALSFVNLYMYGGGFDMLAA